MHLGLSTGLTQQRVGGGSSQVEINTTLEMVQQNDTWRASIFPVDIGAKDVYITGDSILNGAIAQAEFESVAPALEGWSEFTSHNYTPTNDVIQNGAPLDCLDESAGVRLTSTSTGTVVDFANPGEETGQILTRLQGSASAKAAINLWSAGSNNDPLVDAAKEMLDDLVTAIGELGTATDMVAMPFSVRRVDTFAGPMGLRTVDHALANGASALNWYNPVLWMLHKLEAEADSVIVDVKDDWTRDNCTDANYYMTHEVMAGVSTGDVRDDTHPSPKFHEAWTDDAAHLVGALLDSTVFVHSEEWGVDWTVSQGTTIGTVRFDGTPTNFYIANTGALANVVSINSSGVITRGSGSAPTAEAVEIYVVAEHAGGNHVGRIILADKTPSYCLITHRCDKAGFFPITDDFVGTNATGGQFREFAFEIAFDCGGLAEGIDLFQFNGRELSIQTRTDGTNKIRLYKNAKFNNLDIIQDTGSQPGHFFVSGKFDAVNELNNQFYYRLNGGTAVDVSSQLKGTTPLDLLGYWEFFSTNNQLTPNGVKLYQWSLYDTFFSDTQDLSALWSGGAPQIQTLDNDGVLNGVTPIIGSHGGPGIQGVGTSHGSISKFYVAPPWDATTMGFLTS